MNRLYLDYNASAPLEPQARTAMLEVMDSYGNASSTHAEGRKSRQFIELARKKIAIYFQTVPANVIFTSGATEANNLALKGFKGPVIVSAIEHDSVLKTREDLKICPVTPKGVIDLDILEKLLKETALPCLVSVMAANNETGTIQPLKEIIILCQKYGAKFHCDAVQVIGKIPIDWEDLKIDMISISAHKIGGPQGAGALLINQATVLHPIITGGGQERYFRAGTENILGIVGLGVAVESCSTQNWQSVLELRKSLENQLKKYQGVTIFGEESDRLPNTINFSTLKVQNTVQVMHFDLNGISLSAGSACSSGKVKNSHVLQAMKVPLPLSETSIRLSLGLKTTEKDINQFLTIWKELYKKTQTTPLPLTALRRIAQ